MRTVFILLVALVMFSGCRDESKNTPTPDPSLVYFLVKETNPVHGDSFILPLKDPSDIAQARTSISEGATPIVVAEISRNNNDNYSLNKDLLNNRNGHGM
jgi:hypothetical protein